MPTALVPFMGSLVQGEFRVWRTSVEMCRKKERHTKSKKLKVKKERSKEELKLLRKLYLGFQKPYHVIRYPLPEDFTRPVLTYCG